MNITGTLQKMSTELDTVVKYTLIIGQEQINANDLIGNELELHFDGKIYCIACGAKTKKSFAQGFCYNCFISHPAADECILHPEKCRAHEGISRDMQWAENHCLQEHFVYLAISSGLKVGVTRHTQIPTRWIDQGAVKAIKLASTPNRHLAGVIEVALKEYYADKTSWQRMLKNQIDAAKDLEDEKQNAYELLDEELQQYVIEDDTITEIKYPVEVYPKKVTSYSFDKQNLVKGTLTGIKGQYLMFDNQYVLNIRKFGGYEVELKI